MNEEVDIKKLQNCILDIYVEIKKICERNNLRYYAIGGTCIGAVRHHGFIPWDDDLDIAMPDEDYYKFYDIAKKELPPKYRVYLARQNRTDNTFFMKVENLETTFVEAREIDHPESYKGVFVDIMPLFGVEKKDKRKYERVIKRYLDLNCKRRYYIKRKDSIKTKIIWLLLQSFPMEYWCQKWDGFVNRCPFGKSEVTGYLWSGKLNEKTFFDTRWFTMYEEFPFETTTMRCPIGWNVCLSKQFGDYMVLPPENQREVHRCGGIVDLNKSYLTYAEEKQRR